MSLRFAACLLFAAAAHAALFVWPRALSAPDFPLAAGEFSVELTPTAASVASPANSAPPHALPNSIPANEFRAVPADSTPPAQRSEANQFPSPPIRPERDEVAVADPPPLPASRVEVEVPILEPAPPPPASTASPDSTPAPLAQVGSRTPPRLTAEFHPLYPDEARRQGWQGRVLLHVAVDADGRVAGASVLESSGVDVLDEAALRDVKSAKFQPGLVGERPAAMSIRLPVAYRIVD